MPQVFIGCSGFSYQHWKKIFYPPGLPPREWLKHYTTVFSTVELNVTFYRLPQQASFQSWHDDTPENFVFAVKGSRYITHVKKLIDPEEPLDLFFERALLLKEKLRVVLWQFAPGFPVHSDRFAAFLKLLSPYPCHNTFEFRHPSWITKDVISLCEQHGTSLCMADRPPHLNNLPATSTTVYFRRHGKNDSSRYSAAELEADALLVQGHLEAGRNVFFYFNNDAMGHAVEDARQVLGLVRQTVRLHS